jgi:7,8-dihydropterin-6-yl-methyl-4-(beta-D-ribofuranosyl)aminobenzene 5'-phosphate synthase
MSAVKITILVDNNVKPGLGLIPEHGFSVLIESCEVRVLFDTGKGPALPQNAFRLGVNLAQLNCIALSHGHYDHTGGLPYVLSINPGIRVIAHPQIFERHLACENGETRYIGIPDTLETLKTLGANFFFVQKPYELIQGIWFSGEISRSIDSEMDKRLCLEKGDGFHQDNVVDDVSLIVYSPSGPILLLGCSHSGVKNILQHIRKVFQIDRIYSVIGGTHLGFLDRRETFEAIDAFESFGVKCFASAHCTGDEPNQILKRHFGSRFFHAGAGAVLNF